MISFWDFKLSGAPPLLSFGVRPPPVGACRADRDLRAAVGLAGRHLHAARRADGRRRPHVRIVGAARLVALMLFLAGIAINLVLGCWPPRISCRS